MALASVALLLAAGSSRDAIAGFTPAPGYSTDDLGISADTFAVAPDGRFAVARGSTITVYNHADPARRVPISRITYPGFKALGGIAFSGRNTLIVTDNTYLAGAVYSASLFSGAVQTVAAPGTANDIAQVRVRPTDGAVFAVEAHAVKHGEIVRITPSGVAPFAGGLGTGYLGGLAFDSAGGVFVGDTNDPYFVGNAGNVLELNCAGSLVGAASLAGGGGHGVYDLAGFNGDFFATTGGTITRLHNGTATRVGSFEGPYPFPTDVALDASGLIVNGVFTNVGHVFRVRPAAPVSGRNDSWRPAQVVVHNDDPYRR